MLLALVGRESKAIDLLKAHEPRMPQVLIRQFSVAPRALLEGDRTACLAAIEHIQRADFADPEGTVILARYFARLGEHERAEQTVSAAVEQAFAASNFLRHDPWIEALRGRLGFERSLARADAQRDTAAARFADAGGPQLLA